MDTTVFTDTVYVHVFIWIHFPKRFHIAAVSAKALSVLGVDRRPNRIEMYEVSNENALVWTGLRQYLSGRKPFQVGFIRPCYILSAKSLKTVRVSN